MTTALKTAMRDHWSSWPDEYCHAPDSFDRKAFQEKLDTIASKSRERSILRLEWGGEETVKKYSRWDTFGRPTHETIEPKYKLRRKSSSGVTELIPVRRWIITELCEPEQYGLGNNEDIKFENEDGFLCQATEKPKEWYTPLIFVGDHSHCPKTCCETRICLGDYKAPDNAELNWIKEKTYLLTTERITDPKRPIGPAEIAKIVADLELSQPKKTGLLAERIQEIQP